MDGPYLEPEENLATGVVEDVDVGKVSVAGLSLDTSLESEGGAEDEYMVLGNVILVDGFEADVYVKLLEDWFFLTTTGSSFCTKSSFWLLLVLLSLSFGDDLVAS